MSRKPSYVLPIIVSFFLFAMISFVTGFQNPFGVILKEQLSLSNFQSQLGNAANFIAYAFMGLPAGLILQKRGYKFSAVAAVIVGLVGVGLMFASSYCEGQQTIFAIYLAGAFIAGFSMCMLNTVVNPMLNSLGGGGKRGNQLLQFGGATNSLAATICPVLVGYLMGSSLNKLSLASARPALYIAMGIFVLALIVLALSRLPEEDRSADQGKEKVSVRKVFTFPQLTLGVIAIFLYVGIEVGIPNFANLYMINELRMDAAIAGSLVGMYWFLMLIGRLLGGMFGNLVSSRSMLCTVATLAFFLVLGAILLDDSVMVSMVGFKSDISFEVCSIPVNILLLVLCGLCTSVMWGGIFNLAVEGLGRYTAIASGIFMVMVCGGGVLPLIQGIVSDAGGYLNGYWVVLAGVAYLLFYGFIGSRAKKSAETEEQSQLQNQIMDAQ